LFIESVFVFKCGLSVETNESDMYATSFLYHDSRQEIYVVTRMMLLNLIECANNFDVLFDWFCVVFV